MLSRRNIRVKVMQALYSRESMDAPVQTEKPAAVLEKKIAQSRDLFTYLVFFITEVARYAEIDAGKKAGKHLPTEADLRINTKISGNEVLWTLLEAPGYADSIKALKPENIIDRDLLKRIYVRLTETPEYLEYGNEQSRDKKAERRMLEFIFTDLLLPDDHFISHLEEHFMNWDDDAELMHSLVLSYISKPSRQPFTEFLAKDKKDYGIDLLRTVEDKKKQSLELIRPRLKNWDADRIAALDMILIRMGVCEFLYFETIPTKVTINEYIDLAKAYSTPQSGQFVNGLLDNILKDLEAADKISKRNFKELKA